MACFSHSFAQASPVVAAMIARVCRSSDLRRSRCDIFDDSRIDNTGCFVHGCDLSTVGHIREKRHNRIDVNINSLGQEYLQLSCS